MNDHLDAAREFYELVSNISDTDYGDFMRKANVYLVNLAKRIGSWSDLVREKLDEMQFYTQFSANWDVESTRHRLLVDAVWLERRLGN